MQTNMKNNKYAEYLECITCGIYNTIKMQNMLYNMSYNM